jgi:hypothetical protein
MKELKKDPKKLIEPKGLLSRFIKEKAGNYSEPIRRGTPRGEVIGFSSKKYAASLLILTSSDLKLLSQKLGISYGLLRKWRTEGLFKKQIEEHEREFAAIFIDHLLEKWIKEDEDIKSIFKEGFLKEKEELKGYDNDLLRGLLDETKFYSSQLKDAITDELVKLGQKNPYLFWDLLFIKSYLALVHERSLHRKLNHLFLFVLGAESDMEEEDKINIQDVISILEKPRILRSKRMEAINLLEGWNDTQKRRDRIMGELINFLRPLV